MTTSALRSEPSAPSSSGSVCCSSRPTATAQIALATKNPIQMATSSRTLRQMGAGRRPKSAAAGRPLRRAKKYAATMSARFWATVRPMLTPGGGSSVDAPKAPAMTMTNSPTTIVVPYPAAKPAIESHAGHRARPD